MNLLLHITCAAGLESLLQQELADIGLTDCQLAHAGLLTCQATLEQAYQAVMWSRLASRVLVHLFDTPVPRQHERDVAEEIYQAARDFDWSLIFGVEQTLALDVQPEPDLPVNPRFATMRFKDGLVDSFRETTGRRPSIDLQQPSVRLLAEPGRQQHRFWLDFGGGSLHRRGYRVAMTPAPLKENLAAALPRQAGWPGAFQSLFDPMCGSGTLLIEACLMAADVAPGLLRATRGERFGFGGWLGHQPERWQQVVADASNRQQAGLARPLPVILGYDADPQAIDATMQNWLAAGLPRRTPQLAVSALRDWPADLAAMLAPSALIICNPPYGERLGERDQGRALYLGLSLRLQQSLPGQQAAVLASRVESADLLALAEPATSRFYNGRLPVYLRQGIIQPLQQQSLVTSWQPGSYSGDGQDFANRLLKNVRALFKTARREQVSSLRIYDADLPDFNFAIDLYDQRLHVQEYAPPKTIDPDVARQRLQLALHICRQILGLSREQIFIKTRQRQRGNQQYTRQQEQPQRRIDAKQLVREGDGWFLVNLTDYLDAGLFLDHRPLRLRIGAEAAGKRVLNLFAYTCTASVHAALGGASQVTSVDLSGRYLDWGRDNFLVNGLDLDDPAFSFIEADVFEWLKDCRERYDLIFIDPPTFSNSKKFQGTFDVQRDHVALLKRALNRLSPDGVLYFSNNFRRFEFNYPAFDAYTVQEMTRETIGFDFQRSASIHQAWRIGHPAVTGAVAGAADESEAALNPDHPAHDQMPASVLVKPGRRGQFRP